MAIYSRDKGGVIITHRFVFQATRVRVVWFEDDSKDNHVDKLSMADQPTSPSSSDDLSTIVISVFKRK